jgi:hypothetical protein
MVGLGSADHTDVKGWALPYIDVVHDRRHALPQGPFGRESLVHLVQMPDEGLSLIAYTWVDGESLAGHNLIVFGPGVADNVVEHVDGIPVARDLDFDDWRVGGFHLELGEPLRSSKVTFSGERLSCELSFEAMHPPYLYSRGPRGCPPALATDRFEQSGRIRGWVRFDGREIHIDRVGHRDHSWGVREWGALGHYEWVEAQAGDMAVHTYHTEENGVPVTYGYVYRDGRLAHIESAQVDTEFDDQALHRRITMVIRDDADRDTTVRCEAFAHLEFAGHDGIVLVEGALRAVIEGVGGEGFSDFGWAGDRLDRARKESSR